MVAHGASGFLGVAVLEEVDEVAVFVSPRVNVTAEVLDRVPEPFGVVPQTAEDVDQSR